MGIMDYLKKIIPEGVLPKVLEYIKEIGVDEFVELIPKTQVFKQMLMDKMGDLSKKMVEKYNIEDYDYVIESENEKTKIEVTLVIRDESKAKEFMDKLKSTVVESVKLPLVKSFIKKYDVKVNCRKVDTGVEVVVTGNSRLKEFVEGILGGDVIVGREEGNEKRF